MLENFILKILDKIGITLVKVSGCSMNPTLKDGQLLIAKRGTIKVGDIVIATSPLGNPIIKRVIKIVSMPSMSTNKIVKRYWIEGDNKDHSIDSRKYGLIREDKIQGKIIFKFK